MKVSDAIAHAVCFLSPLFLYHQQVMEVVAGQKILEAHEVQEVSEAVDLVDQRELQDHQRK